MQASPTALSQTRFEFRFFSMLASHTSADAEQSELDTLDELGRDGWQIKSVIADPQMPAARLLVALQREISK